MKYAICQELFVDWDWERQCRFIAETGYTGIEIAPFTLASRPSDISADQRAHLKSVATDHGLEIIGLHWLLAKTEGLHLTTSDLGTRERTIAYLNDLTDLCGDLGGTVMVFGSPQQRNLEEGVSLEQAFDNATTLFQKCLPRFEERGVTLCMEPLTTKETNFCNTCADAKKIIEKIGHPNFRLHQDVKAMLSEESSIPELIVEFADITKHFHANDSNLLGPGMGETDFIPIFDALKRTNYDGWVSVEVFDYSPGAEEIAEKSLKNMQSAWQAVCT
ncbi:MAG: sugar phosphate isomerase/epimerase [Planctomycetaceae bacterium]|nr:sugar phosphate isomerase/epimerase [Planctomycetaceae bacterium]